MVGLYNYSVFGSIQQPCSCNSSAAVVEYGRLVKEDNQMYTELSNGITFFMTALTLTHSSFFHSCPPIHLSIGSAENPKE